MKVTLEGNVAEIAAFMALGLPVSVQSPTEAHSTSEEVIEEAVAEPVLETKIEVPTPIRIRTPADARGLRDLVLADIVKHPGASLAEMRDRTGLSQQQVRDASRSFVLRSFVKVDKDPDQRRVFRYTATKAAERHLGIETTTNSEAPMEPVAPPRNGEMRNKLMNYLQSNPSKTSSEIGEAIGFAPQVISSTLATLKGRGVLSAQGRGGNVEPFRYSVAG